MTLYRWTIEYSLAGAEPTEHAFDVPTAQDALTLFRFYCISKRGPRGSLPPVHLVNMRCEELGAAPVSRAATGPWLAAGDHKPKDHKPVLARLASGQCYVAIWMVSKRWSLGSPDLDDLAKTITHWAEINPQD